MREVRDNLWIGDCIDARRHGDDFDTVISMVRDNRYHEGSDYRFPIRDGEHDYETFADAVRQARESYEEGGSLLVHCQAGVSRSTSVVTAMLAVKENASWEDIIYETRSGTVSVSPELRESAERYIEVCERHGA